MRLAAIASLTAHAAAIAAFASFDWRPMESAPAIPVAVLIAPALGDQTSAPAQSPAIANAPLPAARPAADAASAPSLDLTGLLADPVPAPVDAPTTAARSTPKPARQAARSAAASSTTPTPAPLAGDAGASEVPPAAPAVGTSVAALPSAPVVEHGPSLLPGNTRPVYPPIARRRALEGRAVVRATVAADGAVASVELLRSSSHEVLDRTALDAVRGWRFAPARRGDETIAGAVDVPVVFRLEE
jgi:protein TonB